MESSKMATPKNAPRDALVMAQILKDMGITDYEPRVINQMLEFAFRYVTTILDDAKIYSSHAKKPNVDADDVRLAIQCRADQSFTSPPPRDVSKLSFEDIARQKNQTPLPLIKPYAGPRLPPDRYCLTAPNYRLKSLIKKGPNQGRLVPRLSVGAVSSRPTTPTIAAPQTVSVPNKVATPVSVASQRFTVQIPPSQSTPIKPVPATTAVQNVLINPSMMGSKNILITTNMASSQNTTNESNPLKRRKHFCGEDRFRV
uniref:TATA-box binding protein associated factor 9b n=1 Tax=Loxodonta africana TaxID=9785 RepID=G3T8H5_LOXAF